MEQPFSNRLVEFLRSVLPTDPSQLLFLLGLVFLSISGVLRWWPQETYRSPLDRILVQGTSRDQNLVQWAWFVGVARYPLLFAAMAGYWACFRPGKLPYLRVLFTVVAPALFALCLISGRYIYLNKQADSVLESGASVLVRTMRASPGILWGLGSGLHFCLYGTVLVSVFAGRLRLRKSSLPLTLPHISSAPGEESSSMERLNILVWVLVGPLFFLPALYSLITVMIPYLVISKPLRYVDNPWFVGASSILTAGMIIAVCLLVAGGSGRKQAWHWIRLASLDNFLLAAAIPIGITLTIQLGLYLFDRLQWASQSFGNMRLPRLEEYFAFPDIWKVFLFFGAFFEELIFRGLLQARFIQKYGLYRGITFTSLVWAGIHFFSDSYPASSDFAVILRLFDRISLCLVLGFVFSWLTIRSGSILPAAVAHTIYNAFAVAVSGHGFPEKGLINICLWGILAFVLFRNWPVQYFIESMPQAPDMQEGRANLTLT